VQVEFCDFAAIAAFQVGTLPSEKGKKKKKRQLEVEIAGVPHVLGYGGIHGARECYHAEGIILCCDVASLYPSLIIEYNFMSRNVLSVEKYKQIRDERLRLKALKDAKQQPLKIVLNATFGTFKDQYNPLFDPLMSNNICIAGQLLLIDLIEKVEPYCELIQSNTDGIYMKVEDMETVQKIKEIAAEWESRTRLSLEWDIHDKIYQKDVNGYILIDNNGKYKSKGGYLKKLNDLDYDLPIVNKSLVSYLINGTPIEKTINECDELREFQNVVKVSSKYLFGLHGEKKLKDRVLRVFADKREDAQGVFKVKRKTNKEGITQDVAEKIAGTPEKCFIENGEIKGKLIPEYHDKEFYVELANNRLNDILGIEKKKKSTKKKKKVEEVIN
jgi:DNA polymerase elongation subunit (family B)